MEHIYPTFERGRIMKKELLCALRDYSYSALQLQYADYPDGIISGCGIRIEDDFLLEREVLSDYVRYVTEFVLDENLERKQNELEVCRFKLKEGARLRAEYKDFFDIETEYDTVNLANATWTSDGGNTLSKEVTDYFARKVLECENADDKDIRFAYLLLQSKEAVKWRAKIILRRRYIS
ncbi:MAG: hypothetical protein K2N82_14270 [Lachnospiraceae bacterium]|nr:hypothetical protein [Lachnospiraceae bacterium]